MNGAELKRLRNQLGATQAELAQEVDVSTNTIARWERDEIPVPTAIAKLVGLLAERDSTATAVSWRRSSLRDPHYEKIAEALNGQLDDAAFEECAADLLREDWPGLVPVRGGSDDGFDGAIAEAGERPFPLITTAGSAAPSNLKRNLERALKCEWKPRRAIFATSRRVTPKIRKRLFEIANRLGVQLEHIYDQDWFANALYHHPAWCKKLLNVTTRPSALAVVPSTRRPVLGDHVIGRERELRALREIDGDCIVEGVPGAGKTFLLRALALEGSAHFFIDFDREALADAIRAQRPKTIIVDDAHVDPDFLVRLTQLREQIYADFLIIAVTWPGAVQDLRSALQLRSSDIVTLDPIDSDTMVEIIKSIGIHGPIPLVASLVRQAEGRPGLAVTLGYLCLRGDIRNVVLGEAIEEDLGYLLSRLVGPRYSTILGAFALGGALGVKPEIVSNFLEVSRLDLRIYLSSLAAAGVIRELYDGSIAVFPELFRWILVRNTFFGTASLDYLPLFGQLSHRSAAIETLLGARSRGAFVPELENLLEEINTHQLWAEYASLGYDEVRYLLDRHPRLIISFSKSALRYTPETSIPMLLEKAVGDDRPLNSYLDHPLRILQDWATGGDPCIEDQISRRRTLIEATIEFWKTAGESTVTIKTLCIALTPGFEFSETDPGRGRRITISFGVLDPGDLRALGAFWPRVFDAVCSIPIIPWTDIIYLLHEWLFPDHRLEISDEVREVTRFVSERMLKDLVVFSQGHPGVQQRLAKAANRSGIEVYTQVEHDFEILYPLNDDGGDNEQQLRYAVQELARKCLQEGPEWGAARLIWIETEAALAGLSYPRRTPSLCDEVAESTKDPATWGTELIDRGVTAELLRPFIHHAVLRQSDAYQRLLWRCLESERYRGVALSILITMPHPPNDLMMAAIAHAGAFAQVVQACCVGGDVPEPTMCALLASGDERVAVAAAIGEWLARPRGHVRKNLVAVWRCVILHSTKDDYWFYKIFADDQELACDWLVTHLSNQNTVMSYEIKRAAQYAISVLDATNRIKTLQQMRPGFGRDRLVRQLISDDLDVYRQLLRMPELSRYHLAPIEGHPDERWVQKAIIALDAGHDLGDVLAATFPKEWSWSGEESALWSKWASEFSSFREHADHRIRTMAEKGMAVMEARTRKCLQQEHLEAVYGR